MSEEPIHKIPVVKQNFPGEFKSLRNRVSTLERTQRAQNVSMGEKEIWSNLSLENSWANVAVFAKAGYMKDSYGFVHLKGRINGGTNGTRIALLPAGFRPGTYNENDLYSAASYNSSVKPLAAFISVHANGEIIAYISEGSVNMGLGGITFLAES